MCLTDSAAARLRYTPAPTQPGGPHAHREARQRAARRSHLPADHGGVSGPRAGQAGGKRKVVRHGRVQLCRDRRELGGDDPGVQEHAGTEVGEVLVRAEGGWRARRDHDEDPHRRRLRSGQLQRDRREGHRLECRELFPGRALRSHDLRTRLLVRRRRVEPEPFRRGREPL